MTLLRCPNCQAGIRFLEIGNEFTCKGCGQRLRSSTSVLKVNFIALMLGGVPWLAAELLFLNFEYPFIGFCIFVFSTLLTVILCVRLLRIQKIAGV